MSDLSSSLSKTHRIRILKVKLKDMACEFVVDNISLYTVITIFGPRASLPFSQTNSVNKQLFVHKA